MKTLIASTSFKKDLKRYRNNLRKLSKLREVLALLQCDEPIPSAYRPHRLTGDYAGFMECHIEGDFLLIWDDPDIQTIALVRLGSHSELFGKGVRR
jgi:addiction module toxin, relE/stbE family